jgi:diguanylate cyclase (GGDEF)-like protein
MSKRGALEGLRLRLAREQTLLVSFVALHVVTGKLGLALSAWHPAPSVSLIWPPAGLALGALVVLGYRIWPAVLASNLIIHVSTIGLLPAALSMAACNTGESLLAAYLVNRYAGGRHSLQTPRNSFRFSAMVLLASATVSATGSTLSLVLSGLAGWTAYGSIWMTISLGGLSSMLLVAPLIILHPRGSAVRWHPGQMIEAALAFLAVVFVGLVVFYRLPVGTLGGFPKELLWMPVLMWTAFRLGPRAAALAVLGLVALATLGTLNGYGPFARATPFTSLVMVQLFAAMTAVMTLSLAALAAEYAVAEAQLREMVVTDPLTGLPNYRRLLEVLGMEIARADRNDRPFAVVFFDMDGLKRINDEMGHLIGSRAVCRFAETLQAVCRTTDTAARYGGDEFVAALSDTDRAGAELVVRRLAERLAEDTAEPPLAVSAGIAVYPQDGGTPTTLLSAADRALYSVKAAKATSRRLTVVGLREWSAGSR